nr:SPW repeat protein [Aequorivita capsosiphonis]
MNIGYWLIMAGSLLEYSEKATYNGCVVGFAIVLFSVIGIGRTTRRIQRLNYSLAIWLFMSPWILNYNDTFAVVNSIVCASLIIFLCSLSWQRLVLAKKG